MQKHSFASKLRLTLPLLLMLAAVGLPLTLRAQESSTGTYTLTNGTHMWLEGPEGSETETRVLLEGDSYGSEIHSATPVNLHTHQGDYYLALDITGSEPRIVNVPTSNFTRYCVWNRSGYTGYYYQEWDNYRYYLVGTSNELRVEKVEIGASTAYYAKFFNWDFGAAITDITYRNGQRHEGYYWILFDTVGTDNTPADGVWRMSGDTYSRPESAVRRTDGVVTYCDPRVKSAEAGHDTVWEPAGQAALYLPVEMTYHDKEVLFPAGQGLTGITLDKDVLKYGDQMVATPQLNIPTGGVPVRRGYYEYIEETDRYGMNSDYRQREDPGYGGVGTATSRTYYFWENDPFTRKDYLPATSNESVSVTKKEFSITRSALRWVDTATIAGGDQFQVTCTSVPNRGTSGWVYVTVTYNNGVVQKDSVHFDFSVEVATPAFPEPKNAPVVKGFVVGGGRMANVSGNTAVTVHSADSIYALYGGNDIAGWVQGEGGATIQLGTTKTDADHKVHIGYAYGGGCGFYTYQGINAAADGTNPYYKSQSTSLVYQSYYFNGKVYPWNTLPEGFLADNATAVSMSADASAWSALTPVVDQEFAYTPVVGDPEHVDQNEDGNGGTGTIPYIKTAHITVGVDGHAGNDYILIDSLFGGAENAFIGVTSNEVLHPANAVSMDIRGGVLYTVFGGNNYGGSVANTSTVFVNVHNTKTTTDQGIQNTYFTGYGRNFGIRYLFGGGNLVDGSHANVNILGGMIDTCYLGGNMADVNRPIGTVNCDAGNYIFDNDSITKQWVGGVLVDKPLYDASLGAGNEWTNYNNLVNQNPDRFTTQSGRYNIRVLFGGNNRAPMATVATINLLSGGISTVYGGGNAGDMRYSDPLYNLPAWVQDSSIAGFTGWKYQRPQVISTIVHSNAGSHIMVEKVYGGCRMANVVGSTILWLSGGVFGYAYGGNDISGDVGTELGEGSYAVIDRKALILQDVYGGSNGYYHCSKDSRYLGGDAYLLKDRQGVAGDPYDEYTGQLVPTHNNTNLYLNGGKVLFSAYGGGVKANVGFESGSNPRINYDGETRTLTVVGGMQKGSIHVQMNDTTVVGSKAHHTNDAYDDGNAYGGGYLSYLYGNGYACVGGQTEILGSLYAGNDCMGSLNSFASYSIPAVYAPNATHDGFDEITPAVSEADFKASDGTSLNYDAGDGTYNAAYQTYLLLEDTPRINCVYGSGNGAYDYTDRSNLDYGPVCHFEYTEVTPLQTSVFVDINTENGSMIDTVFGGGNGVGVRENVQILFNSKNPTDLTVGTIFGGNNRENMESCVPDIVLTKGTVKNVFGGGNSGSMNGSEDFKDVCNEDVNGVSTYVLVNTDQVTIQDSLFGGCRKADVRGMAYIDIRNTQDGGINYVYGGNDISGSVNGNTRIDVSGGKVNNIYGGSNGRYDYAFLGTDASGNDDFAVYKYRSDHDDAANLVSDHSTGEPFVDSTTVNLYGGLIDNNVYGGGSMGDCRATRVVVNDRVCPAKLTADLTITGAVYGGGEGDWEHLNEKHRGNVAKPELSDAITEGSTNVHLHHAQTLTSAKAYGGGRGGDVENTNIRVYDTWDEPFDAIYGGCWGSHVLGTATLTMQGSDLGNAQNAFQVFGGNDYTGNVFRSVLNIESGKYGSIYGAGNGDYDYTNHTVAGKTIWIPTYNTVPNNEYVEVNFIDGHVDSNLFGGGLMGTTWRIKTNDLGEHIYNPIDEGSGVGIVNYRIPDTDVAKDTAYIDPYGYSTIIVNVHGGTFDHNIFAGGSGKTDQLVYGLKVLNMDGGEVKESVYGGSQRVDDGYPAECAAGTSSDPVANTTLRPSSIMNLAGGIIKASVYGAGYQGNTYGSVYVNIGTQAIEDSKVWERDIAGGTDAYAIFKPGNGISPALTASHVILDASVYGGANWGSNDGGFDFRVPGFFGGESRIYVDGQDYNTLGSSTSPLPTMNIENSIIGSGTSVQGGDVHNSIHVYNYGAVDYSSCHATKTLRSIQRADELYLWNTAIFYDGATDAASAYPSQQLTINRVDTVKVRGYNVMDLNAVMTEVQVLAFYEDELDASGNLVLTSNQELIVNDPSQCANDIQVCDRLRVIDPVTKKYAAMVVNNGVNVDIRTTDHGYGYVDGFGYLFAETGTNAVVTARAKTASLNINDGGFMSSCKDTNQVIAEQSGTSIVWGPCSGSNCDEAEYPYNNYIEAYRVWSVGHGKRTRFAVLLAHADPAQLDADKAVKLQDGSNNYDVALAHAELVLPPTTPGHFYRLGTGGITIEDDNAEMRLVDKAWHPKNWTLVGDDPAVAQTNPAQGTWEALTPDAGEMSGMPEIMANPDYTFGLMMSSGENFAGTGAPNYEYTSPANAPAATYANGGTVITGNNHVNIMQSYYSAQVGANVNASPTMDLYLTYSPNFSSTMLGSVYFTLDEYAQVPRRANYDGNDITTNSGAIIPGQYLDSNLHQPIDVSITIATLLEQFKDMEYDLLAMYNEGRSNLFVRKAVLPATLHAREVWLDKIEWYPENCANNDFNLTGESATVINTPTPNVFRLGVQPMDNISSTLTSTVGWYVISQEQPLDIFTAAQEKTGAALTDQIKYTATSCTNDSTHGVLVLDGKGIKMGELDGRGLAAINLALTYDGNKVYPDGYVGHVRMHFRADHPSNPSAFWITANIKCRTHGDTIYLASAPSITKCETTLMSYPVENISSDPQIGKRPSKYVTSFAEAFDSRIYQEGDVIAILDTVKITTPVHIRGVDYATVPIIRYSGHHSDLPGECGVFRGTMFDVTGPDGDFTATCIDFSGSAVARIGGVSTSSVYKEYYNATLATPGTEPYKRLDTNRVYGPIIAVHDGGTVSLESRTTLHDNYNGYVVDGVNDSIRRLGGAVSVTTGGNLIFFNDVTIEDNFVEPSPSATYPTTGAVYVDGGNVTLKASHKATAVTITDNYIYDGSNPYWTNFTDGNSNLVRYTVNDAYTNDATKRNLFLIRTPGDPADLKDTKTDMIDMAAALPEKTRVGISKWFPGETTRDTIRFAFGHKFTDLLQATHVDNNFISDEGYNIFYEYNVHNSQIFLHRCATFHHQLVGVDLPYIPAGTYDAMDVLEYQPLASATCPTGGDKIIYRVQGGFFPYTYTWSGSSDKTRTTSMVHNALMNEIGGGTYDNYKDAIADTLSTPHVDMTPSQFFEQLTYHVEAQDVSGFCTLKKDIEVILNKSAADNPEPFEVTLDGGADGWVDTNYGVKAMATRNYKAIRITPKVWVDRNAGTIDARIAGANNDYVYQEEVTIDPITGDEVVTGHELDNLLFCEGDIIRLTTTPKDASKKFIMWDFDPYYSQNASYVVPSRNSDVVAYYGPNDYWKDVITSEGLAHAVHDGNYDYTTRTLAGDADAGYVTTYNGDVHIYNENGLAWLISTVNGYNGQQVRPFYFNKVFVHQKDDDTPYDMKDYLWTPVGTQQYGFRGRFIGVGKPSVVTDSSTVPLAAGEQVVIRNIIVNEPSMYQVGFFGNLDTAQIKGIKLEAVFARGGHYVGGLAAQSVYSKIDNCAVSDEVEDASTASILTTHYVSGGVIGRSEHDEITNTTSAAKYVGDAVYSGGMVGHGTATTVANTGTLNISRMSGLYIGGIAGYLDGVAPRTHMLFFRSDGAPSTLSNNYVRILSEVKGQQRVGGVVGYAENTVLENNYAYGSFRNAGVHGGVAGALSNNTFANHNYYAASDANGAVGVAAAGASMSDIASFRGKGNAVTLSEPVYGVNNLTRVLNRWVRQQNAAGGQYKTWRSDLEEVHDGYPIFGQPDMIPVSDTLLVDGCDQVEYQGILYNEDTEFAFSIVDSLEMVDSTLVTLIRLHHATNTQLTDTAVLGEEYNGFGFYVSATESMLLRRSLDSAGYATLVLSDTLQTAFGCDSVITLTLTFHADGDNEDIVEVSNTTEIKVYPNPTVNTINVEAEQMSHVEIYDNEGRVLQNRDTYDASRVTLDLSYYPSGIYYVRIHTPNGITIQKVIKR